MAIKDFVVGAGILGLITIVLVIGIACVVAPIVVAILVANFFMLTGVNWWAVVIVISVILMGIMGRLANSS